MIDPATQYDLPGLFRKLRRRQRRSLHEDAPRNRYERWNGKRGSPAVIADTGYVGNKAVSFAGPSVRGTGAGSVRGRVHFNVLREMQRPGLTIDGNNLVIGFGSAFGVVPYYHGWILAFNKNSLQTDRLL